MFTLYVENREIDVPDNISAQLNFSIDDIRDPSSRNTGWSKTIVLPGTARNKAAFGFIFEMGASSFHNPTLPNIGYNYNAAKGAHAFILQQGIPVFKGVLRLMDIVILGDSIEFEVAVFGELGGLVAAMGDRKLEDLDFAAYDHALSIASVIASWSTPLGAGYYYPFIDYGYSLDKVHYPIENFRPAFHVKEYLDKIFDAAGYTYESSFINSDYFKKLIIPFNQPFPVREISLAHHSTDVTHTSAAYTAGSYYVQFDSVVQSVFEYSSFKKFWWHKPEDVTLKYELSFNWSRPNTLNKEVQAILYTGKDEQSMTATKVYSNQTSNASGSGAVSGTIEIKAGEFIMVGLMYSDIQDPITFTNIIFKLTGQPTVKIPLGQGDTLMASELIPKNIMQRDFLRSIVQLFNLFLDEDKQREKHLKIEPYIHYYASGTTNARNWEGKIDRSQKVTIKPMGELGSRIYEYKYKDDSDYYNEQYKKKFEQTYGNYSFDSGFEFIKDKQSIEVLFSPTPLVGWGGQDRVQPVIAKKKDDGSWERISSNIRILFRSSSALPCTTWFMGYRDEDGVASNLQMSTYGYAGHLDSPDAPTRDLNFGTPKEFYFTLVSAYLSANLFNVFWSWYLSEITDKDSKLLTGSFLLNAVDIHNLDFSKLIYLYGQYWRLNKVIDYSTDEVGTTKCEMIKVIDLQIDAEGSGGDGDGGGASTILVQNDTDDVSIELYDNELYPSGLLAGLAPMQVSDITPAHDMWFEATAPVRVVVTYEDDIILIMFSADQMGSIPNSELTITSIKFQQV
jgi:hypothetical protein